MEETLSMIQQVQSFMARHSLLKPGDAVLVGVSGGADSVCLLLILKELAGPLRLRLWAAHLHHGIRGAAASRDAAFVTRLCARLKIPLQVERRDVPGLAGSRGISLEMAAREARQDFFRRAAKTARARVVATAHTADDQAETLLLRFARGAGMRGLGGIAPAGSLGNLKLIRPLLAIDRTGIVAFLRSRKVSWREDATNRDVAILRNRVRHEILPLLERKLNPGIRQALLRTADILREESDWLETLARDILRRCRRGETLRLSMLARQPVAARRRVWRLWMSGGGVPVESIDFEMVNRIDRLAMASRVSGRLELPGGRKAVKSAGVLRLEVAGGGLLPTDAAPDPEVEIAVPGITRVPVAGWRIAVHLAPGLHKDASSRPGRLPARASLSAVALKGRPLVVRCWRPGDRMKPLGLDGSKKLQDIFIDAKLPASERHRVPVLECGGQIVWLPGYRVAAGWEVSDPRKPAIQIRIRAV